MPTLCRSCRSGEPFGSLVVHTPEEAVTASRSADGGTWVAEVRTGTAVRAMMRKGWRVAAPEARGEKPKVAAVKTPAKAAPKPKKAKAKPKKAPAPDLSILDLSVSQLEEALESGKHDSQLDALLAAEEGGKTRKGAVKALKARQAAI
jgi:hypothetical protein